MKKINTLLFFILSITSFGQVNLVPNPSFEDTLYCPEGFDDLMATKYWYKPTQGSSDYFNECNNFHIPNNYFGYQVPNEGKAYAGIGMGFGENFSNYREYLQIALLSSLEENVLYEVYFHISLADSMNISLKNIGLSLTNNPIGGNYQTTIQGIVPQVISNTFISDSQVWTQIIDTIVAIGGESYLTIGYFKDDDSDDIFTISNSTDSQFANQSYYFIDDVSVKKINSLGIEENKSDASLFSIHAKDGKIISSNPMVLIDYISLWDISGKIVDYKNNGSNEISIIELEQGIYFYSGSFIIDKNTHYKSGRILINH